MTRNEYHVECLTCALADAGFDSVIPPDKIQDIVDAFVGGLDMESEAFGDLNIPNPQTLEINELKKRLKKKDDENEDIEQAWFKKACRLRGVDSDSYIFYRRGTEIDIMERR